MTDSGNGAQKKHALAITSDFHRAAVQHLAKEAQRMAAEAGLSLADAVGAVGLTHQYLVAVYAKLMAQLEASEMARQPHIVVPNAAVPPRNLRTQ